MPERQNLRLRAAVAALAFFACGGAASAQFAPPQQPQQQQEPPPCIKEFIALRDDAQKKGQAIQAASKRKATPTEACGLFKSYGDAETKMIKYAENAGVWCGIPAQAIESMKKSQANTAAIRVKVCQAAAAGPPRPAGPSLSDALGTPATTPEAVKPGRGTFDTLTGTPLGGR